MFVATLRAHTQERSAACLNGATTGNARRMPRGQQMRVGREYVGRKPNGGLDKFMLIVNLRVAKQIGLTVPPKVLAWADRLSRAKGRVSSHNCIEAEKNT